MHQNIRSISRKRAIAALAAMAFILSLAATLTGCGSPETDTSFKPTAVTTIEAKPLTEELVQKTAARNIGDAGLVRYATLTQEGDGKVIRIGLTRPTLCHDGALVGTVAGFAQKTLSALFKYEEVARVEVSMYGTTTGSPPNDELALEVKVDRAASDRIDWHVFDDTTMPLLATSYYVDPRIQANWVIEGGGETPRGQQTVSTPTS